MKFLIYILPAFLAISSCQSLAQYKVTGYLLNKYQGFQTTVDSKLAHDYLYAAYAGIVPESPVNSIFSEWDQKELNQQNLKELAQKTSTDFATLYFSRRLMSNPDNQSAQKRFDDILLSLKTSDYFQKNVNRNTLFVFVPGLGYKSDKQIGADFATQRKSLQELGIPNTIIEVNEFGRVMSNAAIIAENIQILSKTYSSIILVSASKSSSEVAIALGKILKPEQSKNVKVWLSLCGVLRGTPYARQFQSGLVGLMTEIYLSLHGIPVDLRKDMTPEYMNDIYKTLVFPSHIKLVQYIPIPLSGQISPRAYSGYQEMKSEGPNDGRTLLAEQLIDGGIALLSFGSDHYFNDPDIREKSMALGIFAQELVSEDKYTSNNF